MIAVAVISGFIVGLFWGYVLGAVNDPAHRD